MRYVKTCLLPANAHKIRSKTQNSFVPYLTSACQARRSSRTENWSAPSPMSSSTIPLPATASSSKICWTQQRNEKAAASDDTCCCFYQKCSSKYASASADHSPLFCFTRVSRALKRSSVSPKAVKSAMAVSGRSIWV